MPHTKSAKKNMRKAEKRRIANKVAKKSIKKQIKTFMAAAEGPIDALRTEYNVTAKRLDQAAAKKIIHRNTAARKKSQLARMINKKAASASGTSAS